MAESVMKIKLKNLSCNDERCSSEILACMWVAERIYAWCVGAYNN